jgi:hypothetical protein
VAGFAWLTETSVCEYAVPVNHTILKKDVDIGLVYDLVCDKFLQRHALLQYYRLTENEIDKVLGKFNKSAEKDTVEERYDGCLNASGKIMYST